MAYLFEYFVLNLGQAYSYRPKILKNRYLDNIFGANLSQASYVPFTAILITAFQFGWKLKLLFSLYFVCIEKLFIVMGVYRHHWWKTTYTGIFLPILFYISDLWYKYLKQGNSYILFMTLYFMTLVTGVNTLYVFAVLRKFKFGLGRFHSWKEHFKIAPIYSLALSFITVLGLTRGDSWKVKVNVLIMIKSVDLFLKKSDIPKGKFYNFFLNNGIHVMMIYLTSQYKKMISRSV